MFNIEYQYDLTALQEMIAVVEARMKEPQSNLIEAMKTAGNYVMNEWIRTAETKFTHSNGGYAQGIVDGVKYPYQNDPLHFAIIHTQPYALYLEQGYEPYDMKKMLETSSKVRISKKGHKYLVIPFNHGNPNAVTKNAMPDDIYKQAKTLNQSVVTGRFMEGIQQGAKTFREAQILRAHNPNKVERNKYMWGGRLTDNTPRSIYDGMVRFNSDVQSVRATYTKETSIGKFTINKTVTQKTGNTYSTYFTFRVMSEISEGWQNRGMRPMNILKETKERVEAPVKNLIAQGIKADLLAIGCTE